MRSLKVLLGVVPTLSHTLPFQVMVISDNDFAREWIHAWNAKDLRSIMSHYDEDVHFTSPRVAASYEKTGIGSPDGTIRGVEALEAYFDTALKTVTAVSLELEQVLGGADGSCALIYQRETGAKVVECMQRDLETGKVVAVQVFYSSVC